MNAIVQALRSLSVTNRVLIVVALVVVVAWVWSSLRARWRDREHTVYVLPKDAAFGDAGMHVRAAAEPANISAPGTPPAAGAGSAPAPASDSTVGNEPPPDVDGEGEDAADSTDAGPQDAAVAANDTPPWAPDWAEGRRLCPCCGYATDYTPAHRCSLCDWEALPEPVLDDDHLMPPDPDDVLDEARARYRATGSALDPADRVDRLGAPTPRELELRRQLHDRLEYLRTGDRPDSSETWDAIGLLFDQLHQAQERKGLDA